MCELFKSNPIDLYIYYGVRISVNLEDSNDFYVDQITGVPENPKVCVTK